MNLLINNRTVYGKKKKSSQKILQFCKGTITSPLQLLDSNHNISQRRKHSNVNNICILKELKFFFLDGNTNKLRDFLSRNIERCLLI